MREKKKHTVASAAITQAWEDALKSFDVFNIEDLRSEGWRSAQMVAEETQRNLETIRGSLARACKKGLMNSKVFKVELEDKTHDVRFYRPKSLG